MSALLAVVSAVTSTPTPSPEVIVHTVTQTVVPDWIKQTAALGLFVIPGYFASFLHSLVNKKVGLTRWANAVLLFGYSIVLGVLGLVTAGQLDVLSIDWHNPELVGSAVALVLGAASARYAVLRAREASTGDAVDPAGVADAPQV